MAPRLDVTAAGVSCVEGGCSLPLAGGRVVIIVNVEELAVVDPALKSMEHCDCVVALRCGGDRVVLLHVELKDLGLSLFAQAAEGNASALERLRKLVDDAARKVYMCHARLFDRGTRDLHRFLAGHGSAAVAHVLLVAVPGPDNLAKGLPAGVASRVLRVYRRFLETLRSRLQGYCRSGTGCRGGVVACGDARPVVEACRGGGR
ncbi:MAG: hypothetical protein GXO15_00385 [Crenarchaeota archaeon]|nr:hypothetical protein [Thermoproteota archaeon]